MWSYLSEAGGDIHFVLITGTGKFPFREGIARSQPIRSTELTLVDCGEKSEDRPVYFEQ